MTRDQWDRQISDIGHGLWVGAVDVRQYGAFLSGRGIDTVVSCMTKEQHARFDHSCPVPPGFTHWRWYMDDNSIVEPKTIVEIVHSFSLSATLLHCVSGANRSTAMALCRLVHLGYHPVIAANIYYPARGESMSKVGLGMPEMTHQMATNVERYVEFRVGKSK